MVRMLEDNRRDLEALCERFGVARLDVFGSALRDDFQTDRSDLDLLVAFRQMTPHQRADAYFGFLKEFRAPMGVEIDLVVPGAVKNRFIAEDIASTKQSFYAA